MTVRDVLVLHATPTDVGGSQRSMIIGAEALAELGCRSHLLHAEAATPALPANPFATVTAVPSLFANPTRAAVKRVLEHSGAGIAHVHYGGQPNLLRALGAVLPTIATAHVPVCPNGSRFNFATRTACVRAVGPACITVGHRKLGCGHTGDGTPFGLAGMTRAYVESRGLLRELARLSAVIVPGNWQRERLVADGVPPETVHVVHPPIAVRTPPAAELPAKPSVLFAGRLFGLKGVDDLLTASHSSQARHELTIVGDGPERLSLEALAVQLGIADRTHFLGALSPERVHELMASATAVVVPSRWPETFCIVGPEAMALGVPVIAYGHAGVLDWLEDGVNGIVVPPYDLDRLVASIDRLLDDAALGQRLRAGALTTAQTFSARKHAEATAAVYERISISSTAVEAGRSR